MLRWNFIAYSTSDTLTCGNNTGPMPEPTKPFLNDISDTSVRGMNIRQPRSCNLPGIAKSCMFGTAMNQLFELCQVAVKFSDRPRTVHFLCASADQSLNRTHHLRTTSDYSLAVRMCRWMRGRCCEMHSSNWTSCFC